MRGACSDEVALIVDGVPLASASTSVEVATTFDVEDPQWVLGGSVVLRSLGAVLDATSVLDASFSSVVGSDDDEV